MKSVKDGDELARIPWGREYTEVVDEDEVVLSHIIGTRLRRRRCREEGDEKAIVRRLYGDEIVKRHLMRTRMYGGKLW